MKQPFVVIFGGHFSDEDREKISKVSTPYFFDDDQELEKIRREIQPHVYVTIGNDCVDFGELMKLSLSERQKWLHFKTEREIVEHPERMTFCFVHSSIKQHGNGTGLDGNEMISVFITSYNSGSMIDRPIKTLLAQTYKNWEAVIVDDSNGNENWLNLKRIKAMDPLRIRIYRSDRNSGVIGQVKNVASGLCRGHLIMEMDHDDELEPLALERLADAARAFPEAGFFYSDFCEIHEDGRNFSYGEYFAIGYGGYRKEWSDKFNKWINVAVACPITPHTIRYLVSCPNHYRAFRASVLRAMGGWNPNFHVADDYEVMVRAFLNTTMVRIPYHSYVQYRNSGGNNHTFIRNQEIQKLWRTISGYYNKEISARVKLLTAVEGWTEEEGLGKDPGEFDMTSWSKRGKIWFDDKYDRYFNRLYSFREVEPMPTDAYELSGKGTGKVGPLVSVTVAVDDEVTRETLLTLVGGVCKQTYQNLQVVIIGLKCSALEPLMDDLILKFDENRESFEAAGVIKERVIRDFNWWDFEENPTLSSCLNYAVKLVNTGSLTCVVDILDRSIELIGSAKKMFESMVEKFRIEQELDALMISDTQSVIHRTKLYRKHGCWEDGKNLTGLWKDDTEVKIENIWVG